MRNNTDYNYRTYIPPEYEQEYKVAIATHGKHYQGIIEEFHQEYDGPPYTYADFLDFMDTRIGLKCTVLGYDKIPNTHEVKGTWEWDDKDKTSFSVWVNQGFPATTQQMTVMHECVHAIQDFDLEFQEIIQTYPEPIQTKIIERVAEVTAVEILLPKGMVAKDKSNGLHYCHIAIKYGVSLQMASYA